MSASIPVENADLVTVRDAMRGLNRLVDELVSGERDQIVLTRHGKMVAVVISVERYGHQKGCPYCGVDCPYCGATQGKPCVDLRKPYGQLKLPHPERVRKGQTCLSEHTSEKLAKALEAAHYLDLAARARRHEFHDFRSPHAMPQHVLVGLLQRHGRRAQPLIERVKAGDFDASKAESDEWIASPEGQAAIKN